MKAVLLLLMSGWVVAAECPQGWRKSAEIGGDRISAYVSKGGTPLRSARVRLYSKGKLLGTYRTNGNGGINIYNLSEGEYKLAIEGWGSTTIRIDPKLDLQSWPQQPSWSISLSDHGCVAVRMSVG
jgi:hypothetical protein